MAFVGNTLDCVLIDAVLCIFLRKPIYFYRNERFPRHSPLFRSCLQLCWNLFLDKNIIAVLVRHVRCESLIGNPVRIGNGPAAVTLLHYMKKTCSAPCATVSF